MQSSWKEFIHRREQEGIEYNFEREHQILFSIFPFSPTIYMLPTFRVHSIHEPSLLRIKE